MITYSIALDPGSNLGVSIFGLDVYTLDIVSIDAFTMRRNLLLNCDDDTVEQIGERQIRLNEQYRRLVDLFNLYHPIAIASESPYFNARMPTAFSSLVECMSMLRSAVASYNAFYSLYTIDPSSIKKTVGANGIAKKDAIKVAVSNLPIITKLNTNINILDEHAIDAIAVNYTMNTRMKLNNRRF
jgi:Holliday junction resolvasome RuvABC endonuclease subunit